MSIRPLPRDAVDKIKSSSAVASLNHVVCGLLKNSLDARASKVNVNIDFCLGNCVVEDDGLGIEPRDFEEDGGLGKMHHTSKLPPSPKIHGRDGNFVASVATFSLLTISSRHHRHDTCSALTIHNGNVLARSIPAQPGQRLAASGHGTRISVRDLFGSMPVRVKQRGLLFSDRAKIDREWDAVAKEIAALLLAWPGDVSVFVREANTQREARITGRSLDPATRTSRLFVQASLAESEDRGSWVPVAASSRRVRIKGAISTTPVATRRSQIICLGIRPVQNSFGTNVLYEEANKMFKSSAFGIVDGKDNEVAQEKPKKGIEKWPMFFLEVTVLGPDEGLAVDDILGDSRHSLQAIIDLLKVICYGFLKKHWMQPRHVQNPDTNMKPWARRRHAGQPTWPPEPAMARTGLSSRARLASEDAPARGSVHSPFEAWHRTKVGMPLPLKSAVEHQQAEQPAERESAPAEVRRRLVGENGKLLRRPFDDVDLDEAHWENPVFETPEPRIPALPQNHEPIERSVEVRAEGQRSRFFSHGQDVEFEASSITLGGRLSRRALAEAKVLGQVDSKFILLQLPLRSASTTGASAAPKEASSALVMLDQHAADERCRLEELMSTYFSRTTTSSHGIQPVTEPLERPIVFDMSAREGELLGRCHAHLRAWGIVLEHNKRSVIHGGAEAHEVVVSRLPPSISERCQSEPKLAIELVRREIWKIDDDGGAPPRPAYEPGRSWVSCFHSCPEGILELLHSRSCRSAIMFNDELPLEECQQLVARLSRCAFPFQCAHGRPSMAPLVDIGSGTGRLGRWAEEASPAMRAVQWREWLRGGGA
ncbi:hypothetical protein E4U41_006915 [Claviceps citrina]|nr:hypothetical protein E4U41_006915 [Claviceps citrina]